jgi:cell wall-associated NlpC family hydrolase
LETIQISSMSAKTGNSTLLLVPILAAIFLLFPVIGIALGLTKDNTAAANKNGLSSGPAVNPTDPQQARMIALVRAAADPTASIRERRQTLSDLRIITASYREKISGLGIGTVDVGSDCRLYTVKLTAYAPDSSALNDSKGRPIQTLRETVSGQGTYVSLAADLGTSSSVYSDMQKVIIPSVQADAGVNPLNKAIDFRFTDARSPFTDTHTAAKAVGVAVHLSSDAGLPALNASNIKIYVGNGCVYKAPVAKTDLTDVQKGQLKLLDTIDADINWMDQYAGGTQKAGDPSFTQHATQLSTDVQAFSQAYYGVAVGGSGATGRAKTTIDAAVQLVNTNNDGHGAIHYGTFSKVIGRGLDCSGFVSYALITAGILPRGQSITTASLYNNSHFADLTGQIGSGPYTYDQIVSAIKNGTIQPGDLFHSGTVGTNSSHVVMYIGPSYDSPNNIVESTTGHGKNGPQFSDIKERFTHGKVQKVFRPSY